MFPKFMNHLRPKPVCVVLLSSLLLGGGYALPAAQAKAAVSYAPGISLVPEVLMPDGKTDRTYNTPQGQALWSDTLPILQGDKIKLNVFAATGGSDLKEIIVRLDNARLPGMPITTAPWHTVVDTAALKPGYHMVEVWAEDTGDHPQSATKTLTFFITKKMPAKYLIPNTTPTTAVQGIQYQNQNGVITENNPGDTPQLPDFLKGQTADSDATISITARSDASATDTGGTPIGAGSPVTINEPTLFMVEPSAGSTATQYAYALVRDGVTFSESDKPLPTTYQRILIQKRTDKEAGLRPGNVTMWIWGIDAQGRPADPVKALLTIP